MHVLRFAAGLERVALAAGAGGMDAEELAGLLQRGTCREHWLEPSDPVATLTGLAVGNALDAPAERAAHRLEHLLGIRHRHATDKIDIVTRHRVRLSCFYAPKLTVTEALPLLKSVLIDVFLLPRSMPRSPL